MGMGARGWGWEWGQSKNQNMQDETQHRNLNNKTAVPDTRLDKGQEHELAQGAQLVVGANRA